MTVHHSPRRHAAALVTVLLLLATPSRGQFGGASPLPQAVDLTDRLDAPVAHRVYQRGPDGTADIPVAPRAAEGEDEPAIELISASLIQTDAAVQSGGLLVAEAIRYENGAFRDVPTGGPYVLRVKFNEGETEVVGTVGPFFVGDLWVLSGQSNMEGYGDLKDTTPPHPSVMLFGMDRTWRPAEEPLHWLVDSPDPVHSGDPATREQRSADQHENRTKGAGLGLPFATALTERTGVPIGLVAVAHGGTSMAQWDPAKKDEGGNSLYGSMMTSIEAVGGKVKGVLWYQGESDANPEAVDKYPEVFADFIEALRSDIGQPDLPFYLVQIGRFVIDAPPLAWNRVQEAERLIPDRVPCTAVVASVDLELDDLIHVGAQGHKRLGKRLANVAMHQLYGAAEGTTPDLDAVVRGPGNALLVRIKGVNVDEEGVGLRPARHIGGFSIRDGDGKAIPLIYDARVAPSGDAVILDLMGEVPEGASLWYGHGLDPYCNLIDGLDMAVPAFGPVPLDE